MTPPDDDSAVVQPAFDELARLSFAEHSLESVLDKVTELATRILPGRPLASVTILAGGRPTTVAASGELANELDQVQYRLGAGPCLEAASTGRHAGIPNTHAERTWPEFAAEAAARGVDSIFSYPLPSQELVQGGLNVYARQADVDDPRTRDLVSRLAAYAVGPVSNIYLYETAVDRAEHLQAALESRAVIDQAKGILMERFKLTADQAFQILARLSMERNVKLRDVAIQFVHTGELDPS
ncbi:GAF and ANTAR domain-containing protein [Blastococcus sp. LR1]|uniref:GAF and ANTAR domain-containing protein n=1 Tax=Blastococcus sp. LR1 TaxID=2877000 RepID=UPI001CCA408E|nr:GAF and ANTAR domain-containing protein [Blastococcus sp. LR1]MCA0145176.1 GAF and ANTAR domain-containing protein [Blastococcus sp. LR1]